jgi:RHS repeat-associated protein
VATTYGHDILDRLVSFSPGYASGEMPPMRYEYVGDRVVAGFVSAVPEVRKLAFGYDDQTNLSAISVYDDAGTTIQQTLCLKHDALNRIVLVGRHRNPGAGGPDALVCRSEAEVGEVIARFEYDARNRRVARYSALTGAWTEFVFLPDGSHLAELGRPTTAAGAWTPVRDYVWLGTVPLAQIEYPPAPGANEGRAYYFHVDHLGRPRIMTDASGQIAWQATARPYGDVAEAAGATVVTNLRLPGQYDERLFAAAGITGLQGPYYNWNRWYLPSMGRYLELDPIALEGGFNTEYGVDWYSYASGNPLTKTDPNGLTTYWCTSPLHALKSKCGMTGRKSCSDDDLNPLFHSYFCVDTGNGPPQCGGKDYDPYFPSVGDGKPSDDKWRTDSCKPIVDKNKCFDDCVLGWIDRKNSRGLYILGVWDCQTFVKQGERTCAIKCRL